MCLQIVSFIDVSQHHLDALGIVTTHELDIDHAGWEKANASDSPAKRIFYKEVLDSLRKHVHVSVSFGGHHINSYLLNVSIIERNGLSHHYSSVSPCLSGVCTGCGRH